MVNDPGRVVVVPDSCNICGIDEVEVYHQNFPELRISGMSAREAAEHLSKRLKSDLDAVSDPLHRDPVRVAIADVRAFLEG